MSSNAANRRYRPRIAWMLAVAWFTACFVIAWLSGVAQQLLTAPAVLPDQAQSPAWWAATLLVTLYVLFAYLFYWPRGTLHHGRPLRVPIVLLFGVLWGLAQGLLALTVFSWMEPLGPAWSVPLMFIAYSTFIATWHSLFWDIHVAPDHNIIERNLGKVLVAHSPFLLLALLHLAVFRNEAIFIAWHVVALTASAWAMRFPAPWDPDQPGHDGRGTSIRNSLESALRR